MVQLEGRELTSKIRQRSLASRKCETAKGAGRAGAHG